MPQDAAEAVKWYRKAADQGVAEAQFNLGVMYYNGEGVPQDFVMAHMWFNLAAARYLASRTESSNKALANRNIVANNMTPAQIAKAQKLARERKLNYEQTQEICNFELGLVPSAGCFLRAHIVEKVLRLFRLGDFAELKFCQR